MFFFFFQAEDGIRDVAVTGVQTCALPILAAACRNRAMPYVVEPIGMFLPIVRNLWLKRMYHRVWGTRMLEGASAVVATSEQEMEELTAGGIARAKAGMRRKRLGQPEPRPERGPFPEK